MADVATLSETNQTRPCSPPEVVYTFDEARLILSDEPVLALDLETSGLSPWTDVIHVITLYGPQANTIAVLHYPTGTTIPREVIDWLADRPELITHNGVGFDLLFLAHAGMAWDRPKLYDTMIGELAVLEAGRRDVRVTLQDTVRRHLGRTLDKNIEHGHWGETFLTPDQLAYVTGDIQYLVELRDAQLRRGSDRDTRRSIDVEMAVAKPVVRMHLNGMPFDPAAVAEHFARVEAEYRAAEALLRQHFGNEINLGSPAQVQAALDETFHTLYWPDTRAERLKAATRHGGDVEAVCNAVLTFRGYKKRMSMFGEAWQAKHCVARDGYVTVNGRYSQIGTNTGRFSSSNPNMQNFSRDMHYCFGNMPGYAVCKSDYKGLEVRVAASIAHDAEMIRFFNSGEDAHRMVAAIAFNKPEAEVTEEERRLCKSLSFTLIFGGSPHTFYANARAGGASITETDSVNASNRFFERFVGLKRLRDNAFQRTRQFEKTTIIYPTGLRRLLVGPEHQPTTLLNNRVQGIAAAGVKYALIEMEAVGVSHHLAAVIHDEVVGRAPVEIIEDVRREIDRCMAKGMHTALAKYSPINIGVESTWGATWSGDHFNDVTTEFPR